MKRRNALLSAIAGLALLNLSHAIPAQAAMGGETGGGGNSVAIDFISKGTQGIYQMDAADLQGKASKAELLTALKTAKIITTHEKLFVQIGKNSQECDAVNFPKTKEIKINEERWRAIPNDDLKKDLVVHEVLSLLGVEASGYYNHSARGTEFHFKPQTLHDVPSNSVVSITQPILFEANSTDSTAAPADGIYVHFENNASINEQRVIRPRECRFRADHFTGHVLITDYIDNKSFSYINLPLQEVDGSDGDICKDILLIVNMERTTFCDDEQISLDLLNQRLAKMGMYIIFPSPTEL